MIAYFIFWDTNSFSTLSLFFTLSPCLCLEAISGGSFTLCAHDVDRLIFPFLCPVHWIYDRLLGWGGFWHSDLPPFSSRIAYEFSLLSEVSTKLIQWEWITTLTKGERDILNLFPTWVLASWLPCQEHSQGQRAVFCRDKVGTRCSFLFWHSSSSSKCVLSVNFLLSAKINRWDLGKSPLE